MKTQTHRLHMLKLLSHCQLRHSVVHANAYPWQRDSAQG